MHPFPHRQGPLAVDFHLDSVSMAAIIPFLAANQLWKMVVASLS